MDAIKKIEAALAKFVCYPKWHETSPTDVVHAVRNDGAKIVADVGYSGDEEFDKTICAYIAATCPAAMREVLQTLASNAAEVQRLREECERTARNRDMWEGQCERQAEQLTKMQSEMRRFLPLLERVAEGPFWDELTAGLGIATINAYRAALTNQQPE